MENTGYPCPGCGAPADLVAGCRGCGRPPYPPAAEVIRLDREIATLTPQVEQARVTYQDLAGRLGAALARRAELSARTTAPGRGVASDTPSRSGRTRREIPLPRPVAPPAPAVPPVPLPGPGRPGGAETSTRAVQGLLFVLGGLLLGTAAVVFTAVAWAAFGVAGRALILLACTALALAAPLLARRRGLAGTAETFAAVGLLLVLLDGYAAWSVDLLGVAGWPGSRYAALVGGIGTAVAAGYARLSRLTVPWFAALLTAQPVLPLAVAAAQPSAAGWALVLTAVALGDLVVVVVLRNRIGSRVGDAVRDRAGVPSPVGGAPVRGVAGGGPVHPDPPSGGPVAGGGPATVLAGLVLGWVGHGVALAVAAGCALVPLVLGRAAGTPLLAGGPLLLVALALGAGALAAGGRTYRAVAAGLLVPVLATALIRPVAELRPGVLPLAAALVVAALAGAVRAVPERLRTGPRVGALVIAAGLGQVAVAGAVVVGAATAVASYPAWSGADPVPAWSWGWQLLVAVLLTAGAVALHVPRAGWPVVGAVGGTLAVLAAPAVTVTRWPLVVALDLVAAGVLLLAAVHRPNRRYPAVDRRLQLGASAAAPRPGAVVVPALAAAVLSGHALLVGRAAPAGAGTAFAVLAAVGVLAAALGRRGSGAQPAVGGVALAAGLVAVPPAVAVGLLGLGAPSWWQLRGAFAAAAVLVVAVLAVRRHWTDLHGYASAGFAVGLAAVAATPLVLAGGEPVSLYAASGVLLALAAGGGARPPIAPRVVGAGLAGLALLAAAPATLGVLLGLPVRPWSGAPAAVSAPGAPAAGLTLLLLGVAAAAYGRIATAPDRRAASDRPSSDPERRLAAWRPHEGRRPSWSRGWWRPALAALPFGAVALPVLLAAAGAPWPVVPVAAFGAGLGALLVTALAAPRPPLPAVALPVGAALLLPGLGGLLATRAGTLVGLGALVVAAVAVGAAGRHPGARLAGWLAAVASATGFAVTAPLAAGLPLRTTAFAVLAVAALALHAVPLLRPAPTAALEAAAQATAVLALLLTDGALRHAAAVCALWGAAVAVRVLRRDESPAGRRALAAVAGGSELLGGWLLLAAGGVVVLEAYTAPAAALALVAGLVALRTRPGLNSWLALGPGLAAALLPSLVSVVVAPDPQPWRRLALGVVALGAVLAGAARRWQAPVLLGTATLVPLALHELARGWDLLPRWIFLGLGGLALIGLAATYERRRRDLARLRTLVGRMG
ncbi:SCO7613 C-terminal domain-containing membrane protein [Micromonospora sp. NPDC048930]|uniref:SCO7613 C-terminal domain-containing membrane protein n=1 Tax=Micromonospora sp. NPDC048930 TaxID=3364261 RepID=UPI00371848E7